jgi:hypothetical protein
MRAREGPLRIVFGARDAGAHAIAAEFRARL